MTRGGATGLAIDACSLSGALARVENAEKQLRDPSPAALDGCAGALEAALSELREWLQYRGFRPGARESAAEAGALRRAVLRCAELLNKAAEFRTGWNAVAGGMCAGYTAGGVPAEREHAVRVWMKG